MRRSTAWIFAWMLAALWAANAEAQNLDRIEAVQPRAWAKKGAIVVTPIGAWGLDDPFQLRGGGGARLSYWPRPIIAWTLETTAWAQTSSDASRVAQRELRARFRPVGSLWNATIGAEISAIDGKVTAGSTIVPFECVLRSAVGVGSATEDIDGGAIAVMSAGAGFRWFSGDRWGVETSITWRSFPLARDVGGARESARDSLVTFDLGLPLRIGGTR